MTPVLAVAHRWHRGGYAERFVCWLGWNLAVAGALAVASLGCSEPEAPPDATGERLPSCASLGCEDTSLCDRGGGCHCYVPDAGIGIECDPDPEEP